MPPGSAQAPALCFLCPLSEEGHHHKHHFTHYVKRVEIQLDPAQVCAGPGLAYCPGEPSLEPLSRGSLQEQSAPLDLCDCLQ